MGVRAPAGVSASGVSPYAPNDSANGVVQGTLTAVGPSKPFAFYGALNIFIWSTFSTTLTTTAGSATGAVAAAGTIAAGNSVISTLVPAGTTVGSIAGTNIAMAFPPITLSGYTQLGSAVITGLASTAFLTGAAVSGFGVPGSTVVSSIDVVAVPTANPPITGTITISNAVTAVRASYGHEPLEFRVAAAGISAGVDAAATFAGLDIEPTAGSVYIERSFDGGSTWIPERTVIDLTAGPYVRTIGEPERQVLYRLNLFAYTALANTALNYRMSTTGQAATSLNVPTSA
jgi:hypothetical protein